MHDSGSAFSRVYQGPRHYFGPDYFQPVGERIYKKSMQAQGTDLGTDETHPRNGLLLVKALEEMFQDGHLVLIPVQNCESDEDDGHDDSDDGLESVTEVATLKIHVAEEFHQEEQREQGKRQGPMARKAYQMCGPAGQGNPNPEALHGKSLHASAVCS